MHLSVRRCGRGYKTCVSCGAINGQRAYLCCNVACKLRQEMLATHLPFDPVQLITNDPQTTLFSVRKNHKQIQQRNFVQITEVTLALESAASAIISRNAICFVDSCKFDASDATGVCCKHVNACSNVGETKINIPLAEIYTITRGVLWNLNISNEQKEQLWQMYKQNEDNVPAVQRLNASIFAVKCLQSNIFPAGRLHVNISNSSCSPKKNIYACACKKLKIILEADNSVVMEKDICDHLLLVLAAVLSQPNGKTNYANFTNALKSYWMPAALDTPLLDNAEANNFLDISNSFPTNEEDIYIFGEDFIPDDVSYKYIFYKFLPVKL